jgi:hypothetical protein
MGFSLKVGVSVFRLATTLTPGIQIPVLLEKIEIQGIGLWAELIAFEFIFYPKNGFVGLDKGDQQITFIIGKTLFVEGPIEIR